MAVNTRRVIGGGLVAGVVMAILNFAATYFIQAQWRAEMDNLNPAITKNAELPFAYVSWVLFDLVMGIVLIATYAAIRPRFGPGPRTAARAAMLLWMFGLCIWASFAVVGMFSWRFIAVGGVISLITLIAGANSGAIVYKEAATRLHSPPPEPEWSSPHPIR